MSKSCFWIFFLQGSSLPSCLYPVLSLLEGLEPADSLLDRQLWGGSEGAASHLWIGTPPLPDSDGK